MAARMEQIDTVDFILKDIVYMQQADSKDEPLEPDLDFGLFYPLDYVISTWNEHRQHGNYPQAGGYDDQDWRLVQHDWYVMSERYSHLLLTHETWKYDHLAARKARLTEPETNTNALSFDQLFSG